MNHGYGWGYCEVDTLGFWNIEEGEKLHIILHLLFHDGDDYLFVDIVFLFASLVVGSLIIMRSLDYIGLASFGSENFWRHRWSWRRSWWDFDRNSWSCLVIVGDRWTNKLTPNRGVERCWGVVVLVEGFWQGKFISELARVEVWLQCWVWELFYVCKVFKFDFEQDIVLDYLIKE